MNRCLTSHDEPLEVLEGEDAHHEEFEVVAAASGRKDDLADDPPDENEKGRVHDLPAETEGLIPNPKWRNQLFEANLTDRPWTDGDNVNLSVGQGDLQANPLQMAVAYSALASDGNVVTPHLAQSIETVTGETIEEVRPGPKRRISFSPGTRESIVEGMREALNDPTGTAYQVFGNWKIKVAGKTGTAERGFDRPDQSWFAAMAPADDPKIVVVATVEGGGFGADAAAPIVARMLETYFEIPQVPSAVGKSGAIE